MLRSFYIFNRTTPFLVYQTPNFRVSTLIPWFNVQRLKPLKLHHTRNKRLYSQLQLYKTSHEDSKKFCFVFSLLSHEDDSHVADGALKCFASLADRFIRKNVDPMPLAAHGLTKELLNRLSSAGNRQGGLNNSVSGTPGAGASSAPGLSMS